MRVRHKLKMLKQVAEKEASRMKELGYETKISKIDNSNDYVVNANNRDGLITIIIDRQYSPFHTWTLKKR